jgi:hypothetical protein
VSQREFILGSLCIDFKLAVVSRNLFFAFLFRFHIIQIKSTQRRGTSVNGIITVSCPMLWTPGLTTWKKGSITLFTD